MRWNNPGNANRQTLVAAAMAHPGEVLDRFIAELDMPPSLRLVKIGPEPLNASPSGPYGHTPGAAQPQAHRRPGARAGDSAVGGVRKLKGDGAVVLDRVGATVAGQIAAIPACLPVFYIAAIRASANLIRMTVDF